MVLAVACGGALGAVARYTVEQALPTAAGGFPVATLLANALGSLLLGVLLGVAAARTTPALLGPFVGTGVLGGFTTYSTFALAVQDLLTRAAWDVAATYVGLTLVAGLGSAWLGLWAGRRAGRVGR